MYTIKKVPVYNAEKIMIDKCLWGYNNYKPLVFAQLSYDNQGFLVKYTVGEKNPKRTKTEHFESVHLDSCVEFFANFDPDHDDHYFNFETNANGAMNVAYRASRNDSILLTHEEVESFEITPVIFSDHWEVGYKIGFDFIKKYVKDFDISKCNDIKANFYKCGDETESEHYICYNHVGHPTPDFHRPEYFARIILDKSDK